MKPRSVISGLAALAAFLFSGLLLGRAASAAGPAYTLTLLTVPVANGGVVPTHISNSGLVSGYYYNADGRFTHACYWPAGSTTAVALPETVTLVSPGHNGTPVQAFATSAACVSSDGVIVGSYATTTSGQHGCVWAQVSGQYQAFDVEALLFPDTHIAFSELRAINDNHEIAGDYHFASGNTNSSFYATVNAPAFTSGRRVDLGLPSGQNGTCLPGGINQHGDIVGTGSPFGGNREALLWTGAASGSPAVTNLGKLVDTSYGNGLNDSATVTGIFRSADTPAGVFFAYLSHASGINASTDKLPSSQSNSVASTYNQGIAVNNSNVVVGEVNYGTTSIFNGFVWTAADGSRDLNDPTLVSGLDPNTTHLGGAFSINNAGVIIGQVGTNPDATPGSPAAYLLTPTTPSGPGVDSVGLGVKSGGPFTGTLSVGSGATVFVQVRLTGGATAAGNITLDVLKDGQAFDSKQVPVRQGDATETISYAVPTVTTATVFTFKNLSQ